MTKKRPEDSNQQLPEEANVLNPCTVLVNLISLNQIHHVQFYSFHTREFVLCRNFTEKYCLH
jgi:hypothetical protein